MSYLVSVVVPTRNRYQYLKCLIKLIDSFKLRELEFVIQDNSDDNSEIKLYLSQFSNNKNIKYFYCTDKLTMSENANLAILNSTGEYVCFIGDDDGLCRNIVDCAKWMKKNEIDSVFSRSSFYSWGKMAKLTKNKRAFIKHDAKKEIDRILKKGLILNEAKIPLLYHGIVKREKLNQIYKIGKTYFPSNPPDIASAISLAFVVENYYEVNTPIIINGSSQMTGGGVIKEGGVVQLKDVLFINEKERENWEKEIPPIWCGSYAWPNSAIKTLRHIGKEDLIGKLNRNYYLAHAVAARPKRKELLRYAFKYSINPFSMFFLITKLLFLKYFKKLKRFDKKNVLVNNNVMTIIEAEDFFYKNSLNIFNTKV